MLPDSMERDFFDGRREGGLLFVVEDEVEVIEGPYSGRLGWVVALDRREAEPRFLVDFNDGTDELISQSGIRLREVGGSTPP